MAEISLREEKMSGQQSSPRGKALHGLEEGHGAAPLPPAKANMRAEHGAGQ